MELGIGLPNAVPGTSGRQLVGWARAADEAGFSEDFSAALEKLDRAWQKHGRQGQPRKMALGYFSLGDDAEGDAERGTSATTTPGWAKRSAG